MPILLSDADEVEYWRKRAEEARAIAEEMKDENTKSLMLGIAASYEKIAKSQKAVADYQMWHRKK